MACSHITDEGSEAKLTQLTSSEARKGTRGCLQPPTITHPQYSLCSQRPARLGHLNVSARGRSSFAHRHTELTRLPIHVTLTHQKPIPGKRGLS